MSSYLVQAMRFPCADELRHSAVLTSDHELHWRLPSYFGSSMWAVAAPGFIVQLDTILLMAVFLSQIQ